MDSSVNLAKPAPGSSSAAAETFLSVRDLMVHFPTSDGVVKSVNGLSFDLKAGETLGIVGESGSGKSVSSMAIMGLHYGTGAKISGEIVLEGTDLLQLTPDEMRRKRGQDVAMIFQDPLSAMHPYYTVGNQIMEPTASTTTSRRRRPRGAPSRCWTGWASRTPTAGSTTTRTSSRAACASAR